MSAYLLSLLSRLDLMSFNLLFRYYHAEFDTNLAALSRENLFDFDWRNASVGKLQRLNLEGLFAPDVMSALATSFIRRMSSQHQRFFIYYPMLLAHARVKAPPGTQHSSQQEGFEHQVAYLDKLVGRVRTLAVSRDVSAVERQGLLRLAPLYPDG